MRRFAVLVLMSVLLLGSAEAWARSEGIVAKPSAFSVKVTMDRMEALFKSKGFRIFARVDHTAAAASIDREIDTAELLIFGTPKITTPLMQENIVAGLDLPLKALVYEEEDGQVFLVYNHPGYIARRHEIKGRNKLIGAISRILANLTDQVVKEKL